MRRLVQILVLLAVAAGVITVAQAPAPTARQDARIRVADIGAVGFVAGGDYFAVGSGQQLQLFDLSEPDRPRDLVTLTPSGRPRAIAASDTLTLVAVSRATGPDEIVVVAPDPYRRGELSIVNALQTSESVNHILISPDNAWAAAISPDGYTLLRLTAPDVIESAALRRTAAAPVAAALLDDALLLALAETPRIDRLPLQFAPAARTTATSLTVDATVTALAVSDDGDLAAAALENDDLLLFDPETLQIIHTLRLEDGPATALHIADVDARRVLIVQIANRPAVMLLDISAPEDVTLPGSAGIGPDAVVSATAASGTHFALADGDSVTLFTLD